MESGSLREAPVVAKSIPTENAKAMSFSEL